MLEKVGAPERIRTSDLCLRRAVQYCSSALAVTAISPKTLRKPSISHERHEAGYRLRRLDLWSIGAKLEHFGMKFSEPKLN